MKSALRHLLPFGLVRSMQLVDELVRVGVPRGQAWRRVLAPGTPERIKHLDLDLFPADAFTGADCIVDVGANVGDWTEGMLAFVSPRRVICVEPDPALAGTLRTRFADRPLIAVQQMAVGASAGTVDFTLMKDPVLNSVRRPTANMAANYGETGEREVIKVEVRPLDAIVPPDARVRILKIDVQGFEREVLAGARATLRRTDYVLMEVNFQPHYDGEAGFFELDAIMQENGFCIGDYSPPKGGRRQALYADVLYLRKDS